MLPQRVRVSAPAKVLLFGEHAVVYGCPSVAAALTDLRLVVTIERVREEQAAVELVFEGIAERDPDGCERVLKRRYAFEELRKVVDGQTTDTAYLPTPSTTILERIEQIVHHEATELAKPLRPALFMCCALLHSSPLMNGAHGGLRIHASAGNFPIGAGLGSSAAFGVALAGGLMHYRGQHPHDDIDLLNQFAFSSEVILHGSPSGVDNTVSAFGGALLFCRVPTPSHKRIMCDLSQFRFLIVNTRVPRSTKELVAGVRKKYDTDQSATQAQFDAIQDIVTRFTDLGSRGELTEAILGSLMVQNHTILNELGVGHARIEDVVRTCSTRGCWTKLTGAGGGGCTVTLIPNGLDDSEMSAMTDVLQAQGFQCFVSAVGGSGFTIDNIDVGPDRE